MKKKEAERKIRATRKPPSHLTYFRIFAKSTKGERKNRQGRKDSSNVFQSIATMVVLNFN
jgi:hypothetical protein